MQWMKVVVKIENVCKMSVYFVHTLYFFSIYTNAQLGKIYNKMGMDSRSVLFYDIGCGEFWVKYIAR